MPVVMGSYHTSKTDLRKSNKPIMEKKRRARINQCLDELKSLILEAMKKDPARHAKLEKADILEMTVKHLQDMQRTQMRSAVAADPSVLTKFHSGFNECAHEVTRYVSSIDGVDEGVKRRLLGHLTGCMTGLNQVLPLAAAANHPGDVNNNMGASGRLQMLAAASPLHGPPSPPGQRLGGVSPPLEHHLLASPSSSQQPPTSSPLSLEQHRSAFRAVQQRLTPPGSPLLSDSSSDSCHQELRVEIAEPTHSPPRHSGLLMAAPRPSSSAAADMWRPW